MARFEFKLPDIGEGIAEGLCVEQWEPLVTREREETDLSFVLVATESLTVFGHRCARIRVPCLAVFRQACRAPLDVRTQ